MDTDCRSDASIVIFSLDQLSEMSYSVWEFCGLLIGQNETDTERERERERENDERGDF